MHTRCPAFYVDVVSGEFRRCTCPCHPEDLQEPVGDDPLPHLIEQEDLPDLVIETERGERLILDHKTDEDRARVPGRCEHCGAPCRRYFAVGHDAKLKSELKNDPSPEAFAELLVRGWLAYVGRTCHIAATRDAGYAIAQEQGWNLVARRNAARASRHSD